MKSSQSQTWGCIATACALVLAGCAREAERPADEPVTCRAERRDIVASCSENGILEAHRVYAFYPAVGENRLVKLHVQEGDIVRQGDLLFEFDKRNIEAEKGILTSKLNAAETRLAFLRERRAGTESVEARQQLVQMGQERNEAERLLEIKKEMVELGLSPDSEQQQLEARLHAAELGAELATLQLEELEKHQVSPEIADIEAQILQHRNALRQLKKKEKDFASVAPFDGRIVRINDTIKNLSSITGEVDLLFRRGHGPLLILADTESMRVLTRFFERDVARIRVGQTAYVSSKHVPGKTFEGKVVSIGELGDTLGETTTVSVEVIVRNEDNLLKPGLKAETGITVAEAVDLLAVPVEFIRNSDAGQFVWRPDAEGDPEAVSVTTGISDGRYTGVEGGLQEGDILVME